MVKNDSEKIKKRYNRVSRIYDLLEEPMETMTSNEWRDRLIDKIQESRLLEIGLGPAKILDIILQLSR